MIGKDAFVIADYTTDSHCYLIHISVSSTCFDIMGILLGKLLMINGQSLPIDTLARA